MQHCRIQPRSSASRLVRVAIAGIFLAGIAPALAQEQPSPLRFLRPWLEQQLGVGEEPAAAAPAEQPDAAGPDASGADQGGNGAETGVPVGVTPPPTPAEQSGDAFGGIEGPPVPPTPQAVEAPAPEGQGMASEPADAGAPAAEAGANASAPATAPAAAPPAELSDPGPQPLRIGVLAGRDVMATMAAVEPISKDLTQALGRPVEILPLSSYAAMIDAQAQRRIDGAFYSASAYALAEANCRCLEPLAAPAAADGTLAYHAIIVARANSGIATTADLQGRAIAVGAEDSIGARRMQLAGLLAEGLDPGRFGSVREVGSAEDAVRSVVSGAADAAFAWSSMSGDLQAGYSRGTLADLTARGELAMNQIAVIWRSAAITHGPFAVLETLPETDKSKLEAYLLALEVAAPAAYDMLNPYYSGGYRAVEPADYAGLGVLTVQNVDAVQLPRPPVEAPPAAPAE